MKTFFLLLAVGLLAGGCAMGKHVPDQLPEEGAVSVRQSGYASGDCKYWLRQEAEELGGRVVEETLHNPTGVGGSIFLVAWEVFWFPLVRGWVCEGLVTKDANFKAPGSVEELDRVTARKPEELAAGQVAAAGTVFGSFGSKKSSVKLSPDRPKYNIILTGTPEYRERYQ